MARTAASPVILDGPAIQAELVQFIGACSRARIAVAYWGDGAVDRLNLQGLRKRKVDTEIICDLMSGACNPTEIELLVKLFGSERVRSRDGLHAKVWITDAGCTLGSSNISANGLGHESDETIGLVEANLAFSPMTQSMTATWENWYLTSARAGSVPITVDMIREATERWKARRAMRTMQGGQSGTSRSHRSLLAALRDSPGQFRDKPFKIVIYAHGEYSPEAERGLEEANAEYRATGGKSSLEAYESWRVPGGTYVLDFNWNPSRKGASLDCLCKTLTDKPFRRLKGTSITLCMRVPAFEGLSIGRERAALNRAATAAMRSRGKSELELTAEEFSRFLTEVS